MKLTPLLITAILGCSTPSTSKNLQSNSPTPQPTSTSTTETTANDPEAILAPLLGNTSGSENPSGGLGLKGTGVGDGGTGEGTLCCGSDPLSSGGKLGVEGPRPPEPKPIDGKASVKGALDKDIIRRVVRRAMPEIKGCYEKGLLSDPSLKGTVVVDFVIAPKGSVSSSTATKGINAKVDACIAEKIGQLSFPTPTDGKEVTVSYPFTFSSAE